MTTDELREFFDAHDDDYLQFDRVKEKLHRRPDLHAFLLLDRLVPGDFDMVEAAEHDQIYLQTDPGDLLKVATEDQLLDLYRCGVLYADGSLYMFV